jgi:hypothetical protein
MFEQARFGIGRLPPTREQGRNKILSQWNTAKVLIMSRVVRQVVYQVTRGLENDATISKHH